EGGAGAIYYVNALDVVQSTITGNTAPTVGGLYLYNESGLQAARADHAADTGGREEAETAKAHGNAIGDGGTNFVGTILAANFGIHPRPLGTAPSDPPILGTVDPGVTVTDPGGTQFGPAPRPAP